ncbi:MAG: hypothetical protein H6729_05250 [Deltaproteobacteria bacterium]|nr:hypothetical protein [Deltaproteobacteria bacterium]
MRRAGIWMVTLLGLFGCSSDADRLGVGAECTKTEDCAETDPPLQCLTSFKGGYCGLTGCTSNADCPDPSICVTHSDGSNYCFRSCQDKSECNANRSAEQEANCSSNITRVDGGNQKACVPPSG